MHLTNKEAQRLEAKEKREHFLKGLSDLEKQQLSQTLCEQFCKAFPPTPSMKVAAYWPLPYEADTRPLLARLNQHKIPLALPRARPQAPLTFHLWAPDQPLVKGPFQVHEPAEHATAEDLSSFSHILIPLLAFDAAGNRLGYGQGHYDRTLVMLTKGETSRASHPRKHPLLVGYAFACQELDEVTTDPHDQALDAIVTEKKTL